MSGDSEEVMAVRCGLGRVDIQSQSWFEQPVSEQLESLGRV